MEIRTVAVLGAGAIGGYFINGLREKLGGNLWVVADGARKERLERNGLLLNGRRVSLNVRTPDEAHGADLLIICVKYGALRASLDDVARVADGHTLVLATLNGVDSEEIVAERIGWDNVMYSLMKISIQRVADSVTFDPEGGLGVVFGEVDGSSSERVEALKAVFDGSALHYSVSADIIKDLWFKFGLNISRNMTQAIIDCGFGAFTDSEHVKYIAAKMRNEVIAVAAARGIDISDINNPVARNSKIRPDGRFSTLQDLDAKRPTEVDMFSGALVRMGKDLGVPTPFNDFAYHAIKALEEKNAGKFDY